MQKLFSVTASDCEWDYLRGSGKGGQKKNKTSSAVRCTHRASGAVGYSEASRSQYDNREIAFKKMAQSPEMQRWLKIQTAKLTGEELKIKENVEHALNEKFLLVEGKNEKGLWETLNTTDTNKE